MALTEVKKTNLEKDVSQSETDSDDSGDESMTSSHAEGNVGWADSIAKVLSTTKPKTKKTLVLSRAKKVKSGDKEKVEKGYGFEVEGEIKEEKPIKKELEEEVKHRKNVPLALRVKPTWRDIDRERTFRKVATKGVVQLFNAVRTQQNEIKEQLKEAGPLDSRKDAVLNNINKRKFLDVLMSGNRAKSMAVDNTVKSEVKDESSSSDEHELDSRGGKKKSEWSVLRGDFMTNKNIKHWDEEEDSDNNFEKDDASDDDDNE